jgi:hypothetical protein
MIQTLTKLGNLLSLILINTRSKNFGPLFTKIAQTEKCEIWYTYSLYGEVQNANIFFLNNA